MNNFAFKRKLQQQKFAEQPIKPIETQYKGYRFRSRLEARWAVFFDALGLQWEYEKQGYKLPGVGWYLPDFWLPQANLWVEIKPESPLSDKEKEKLRAFSNATGIENVYVLRGPPVSFQDDDRESRFEAHVQHTVFIARLSILLEQYRVIELADYRRASQAARSARFEHGENGERGL